MPRRRGVPPAVEKGDRRGGLIGPGPKGPRKTTSIRDRVLVLRAQDQSVTEIADALTAAGTAVSAQTVWAILKAEGLERLERRGPGGPR